MANPKFEYNTPNGGKGSLTLMKNVVFNSSMCDGIYLKTRVPASTTTTTIKLYRNHASGRNDSYYGKLTVELSEAVDEYLTILILKSSGNESIIITPGKTTVNSQNNFDSVNPSRIVVYRNKGAVYDITSDTNSYIGQINRALDSYGADVKVEPTNSFTLTCNDETIYVYPLCKGFEIESNGDDKISSIHLPVFSYNGEIYYPTIKITNDKKGTISKVVGYVPDVIGDKIKEKEEITEEDAGTEDTGDYVFDPIEMPDLPDFVMPDLPEVTYEGTVKDIIKDSTTEAVKETTIIETRPSGSDGSGSDGSGSDDSGSDDSGNTDGSENNNYTIIGADTVQFDVDKEGAGAFKYIFTHDSNNNTDMGSSNYITNDYYTLYDNDGNIEGVIVQIYNEDGSVAATYVRKTGERGLKGAFKQIGDILGDKSFGDGILYKNDDGGFTYIDNDGNITISDGTKEGTTKYTYTGGTNASGHEVYYGPDGFPVYVYTDPETGEKTFM